MSTYFLLNRKNRKLSIKIFRERMGLKDPSDLNYHKYTLHKLGSYPRCDTEQIRAGVYSKHSFTV